MTNLAKSLSMLVAAGLLAVIFGQPAVAQTAKKLKCNGCVKSKQLKNGGIKSKDMKPAISLGTGGNAGTLSVKNAAGTPTVSLDGGTGNVTNFFANTPDSSNGLVKAWAKIESNGTIHSCWRCNMDTNLTRRLNTGRFEVDFTPLTTDLTGRPFGGSVVTHDFPNWVGQSITVAPTFGDTSSLTVRIALPSGGTWTYYDADFTVMVY